MIAVGIMMVLSLFLNIKKAQAFTGCDTVNAALTEKFRFLGSYTSNGHPEYLESKADTVSQSLIDFVNTSLPESRNLPQHDGSYFSDNIQLNTELKESSKVYLTFVHEGAGWKNTLGFYTYDINNPPQTVYDIDSLTIIFPNVTNPGVVAPGDKVYLGEFPANTGIGYFLIAQGWIGDTICIPSHIVFTDRRFNTFTTEEYRQQTILLNYEAQNRILLGFEDQKRPGGDNDFNDAVFYITAKTGSIDTTNIPKIPTATIHGDTTFCSEIGIATVQIDLFGKSPWNIVYNDGEKNIAVDNISSTPFTFTTNKLTTYSLVSVSDRNGKGIVNGSATIALANTSATLSGDTYLCGDQGTATLNVELQGTAPWNFKYTDGKTEHSLTTDQQDNEIQISEPGSYQLLEVSDAHCPGTVSGQADVISRPLPTATISGEDAICGEGSTATVNVNLQGSGPFSFSYSDGENETDITSDQDHYDFEVNKPGSYTLISVSDAYCSGTVEGQANIHDKIDELQAEISAEDKSCTGEPVMISVISDIPEESMNMTTTGNGVLDKTDNLEYTYTPAEGEAGVITFNLEVINTCGSRIFSKEVTIIPRPEATFEVSPSELYSKSDITFIPEKSDLDSYQWNFGDENESDATMPVHQYDVGGKYTVSLTVEKDGCSGEGSQDIEVLTKEVLYVPNAFSPYNNNAENRVVKVYGNNVSNEEFFFRIVNRWGKTMYETKSFTEANSVGWDGINNNTDVNQELNVYSYVLRGKFNEGDTFQRTGTVTLVK